MKKDMVIKEINQNKTWFSIVYVLKEETYTMELPIELYTVMSKEVGKKIQFKRFIHNLNKAAETEYASAKKQGEKYG